MSRVDIIVNAESLDVLGSKPRSGIEPVFHVTERARQRPGEAPWVILNALGHEPVQPAQYALHVLHRDEWPRRVATMWGDLVALMFAAVMPERPRFPWRRPAIHVLVRAAIPPADREEFETRGRDALTRLGAKSIDFQWQI